MHKITAKNGFCLAAAGLATMLASAPARAVEGTETYSGEYTISFLGLPVARSKFVSVFEGDNFTVKGSMSSAGMAKLFDSTTGSSFAAGSFIGKTTRPQSFETQYKSGKKRQLTSISFAKGAVSKTVNDPPLKKRKNQVPLDTSDLKAVNDPVSATLIRADSPDEVCGRTLKLFDGEMRVNLALSHVKIGPVPNYKGDAVTCSARFIPVSGYRTKNRTMDYLKSKAKISISFAQLGETGIYAPVRATITTTLGPVTVTAKRTKQ